MLPSLDRLQKMEKTPLYRKVNTTAHGVHHLDGGDFRDGRTARKGADLNRLPMRGNVRRGRDYTPLFRFLLSKVGQNWDEVFSEATKRLDDTEPVFWLVARREAEKEEYVRIGESSYFSGLFVTADGTLQKVNSSIDASTLEPECKCCTYTFNGVRFSKPFKGFSHNPEVTSAA